MNAATRVGGEESEGRRGSRLDDSPFTASSEMIASPPRTTSPRATSPTPICQRYVLSDDELSETFDLLDVDKDGRLSRVEISALLRTVNVEPTRIELDFIFHEMDVNDSGLINKEEFVRYMRSPPVHRTTLKELESQFRDFDTDGDGAITEEEMASILMKTTDLTDRSVIHDMFKSTDADGDGRISFFEFVRMMQE
ncbi:hypothetical protein PENTCL1PPCAC_28306 [Pristionchus entomophagus]|uniref:EF-hand domain-containing protein n=1 Tax=Pristionchus entomophagus TaxID=358040 RepID=A0AAV5UIJ0_9BILA|nr:hypothetical protein PENTCL1PPCAC_28306 [Pristionchus entomophagus]